MEAGGAVWCSIPQEVIAAFHASSRLIGNITNQHL